MGETNGALVLLADLDSVQGIIPDALIELEQEGLPDTRIASDPKPSGIDKTIHGRTNVLADMHALKGSSCSSIPTAHPLHPH